MARRVVVCVALAAAVVLAAASPAMASAAPTQVGIAFFDLDDAFNTSVSVQATRTDSGGTLFLFATQSYCDTATDELVFRSFFGSPTLSPQEFTALPNLKGARLNVTTTVTGSETRVPNCASPDFNNSTFTSLGSSMVTLQVGWAGSGAVYEVQPGITGRAATATGSLTGTVLNVGSLGTAGFAELRLVQPQQ